MRLITIISSLLFALVPSRALPNGESDEWDGQDGRFPRYGCLSDHAAAKIVSTVEEFFVHIDPLVADKFLTPDFEYFSDSTNYLNTTKGAVKTVCLQKLFHRDYSSLLACLNILQLS